MKMGILPGVYCKNATQLSRVKKGYQKDAKSSQKDGYVKDYTNLKTRVSPGVYCKNEGSLIKKDMKNTNKT